MKKVIKSTALHTGTGNGNKRSPTIYILDHKSSSAITSEIAFKNTSNSNVRPSEMHLGGPAYSSTLN